MKKQDKRYTLIQSSKDKNMYAIHQTHILKLDDVPNLDTDFICVDVSNFKEEVKVMKRKKITFI